MSMVAAVISLCLVSQGQCDSRQVRVERSACGVSKAAQVPVDGEWRDARVRVNCAKK